MRSHVQLLKGVEDGLGKDDDKGNDDSDRAKAAIGGFELRVFFVSEKFSRTKEVAECDYLLRLLEHLP